MPSRASTVAFLAPRPRRECDDMTMPSPVHQPIVFLAFHARRECDDMTMPSLIDLAAGAALAASYTNPWNS